VPEELTACKGEPEGEQQLIVLSSLAGSSEVDPVINKLCKPKVHRIYT